MIAIKNIIDRLLNSGVYIYVEGGRLKTRSDKSALTPEIVSLIKSNKDELLAYFSEGYVRSVPVVPRKVDRAPLSFAQQRLWLLDKIDGDSVHYNMSSALRLTGELNVRAVTKALNTIVARHETLRTVFSEKETGEPQQLIQAAADLEILLDDLSALTDAERAKQLSVLVLTEASKPFDLSTDLMLRAQLVKVATQAHVLLVTMHHIASDGWSTGILINEFSALYTAYVQEDESPLPALEIQYADYAHWQRDWLQGEVLDKQLGYWQSQLAGLPAVHSLPLDKPRPGVQTFSGATHHSVIPGATGTKLNQLCKNIGGTLFMGLHAAFSVLLARYSNETDIVVGSPIANREQAEVANLIGFFVNTLVLRSDLSDNPSFSELLEQSKTTLLDAYAHQQVPFEQVVEKLQPERSLSHSALFQVMLVLQNNEEGVLELPDLTLSPVEQSSTIAKYDLTLTVTESKNEHDKGLGLHWEYNTDLFEAATIERLAKHFELLLTALLNAPQENVFAVEMLPAEEVHQQLVQWNDSAADFPQDTCIHQLFEQQAAANPDAVAVVFEDAQLSYGELNARANQLAQYLIQARGVKPDTLVGICVERSLEMLVGIMGILKAGGAYVPLDPSYPKARLDYMLADASLDTVLMQSKLEGETPINDSQAVYLDSDELLAQLTDYPADNVAVDGLSASHLAYVIYTSGSTGNPKGVMVEHQNVGRLFDASEFGFSFNASDVWTLFHSFAFDFSVWEVFGALLHGGKLVVVPKEVTRSTSDFWQLLHQEQVSVLNQTPSAFSQLIAIDNARADKLNVRCVVFGGEALNYGALRPWVAKYGCEQPELINMYGITETTVHVTYRRIGIENIQSGADVSNIGTMLPDLNALVVSSQEQLLPVGVAGELLVGGAGVARGYLNRPELTAQKFIVNPYYDAADPHSSKRLYKTGDLVRWLPDGHLEYLGRIDHQVKIRGFRIELGEIEHALVNHGQVKDSIVLAKEGEAGDKRLVAYVVTENAKQLNSEDEGSQTLRHSFIDGLRQSLTRELPDYMVPSVFVVLENLPLTSNGKVERKRLPEPDISQQQAKYVAPSTDAEKRLCQIWRQVLDVERVGITDNFFELGGHSLTIITLVVEMNKVLNANIQAKDVFAAPTIKKLLLTADFTRASQAFELLGEGLSLIDELQQMVLKDPQRKAGLPTHYDDFYPLSAIQQSMVFFAQTQPDVPVYHDQFPFISPWPDFDLNIFQQAIEVLCDEHPILRTSFDVVNFDVPMQVVHTKLPVESPFVDLSHLPAGEQQAKIKAYCQKDLENKFEFQNAQPLWRLKLFALGNENLCLILSFQHAILDGWSVNALMQNLLGHYTILSGGKAAPLETDVTTGQSSCYKDYVAINLARATSENSNQFWQDYLKGYSRMKLPFNYSGRAVSDEKSMQVVRDVVDKALLVQLQNKARQDGFTIKEICLAAHVYLLSLLTGDSEILTGIVTHDRPELPGSGDILGCFLNTVPLRLAANTVCNKVDLLSEVQGHLQKIKTHELFLGNIALIVGEHNPSGNPLFDTIFNFTDFPVAELAQGSGFTGDVSEIRVDGAEMTNTLFDLEVHKRGDNDMFIQLKYVSQYFDEKDSRNALDLYKQILAVFADEQHELDIRQFIDVDNPTSAGNAFNKTDRPYIFDKTLEQLFEQQVERTPDAVALRQDGVTLTYQALNQRANQIARLLLAQGVSAGQHVGLIMSRSFDLIAGMFGILKVGAVYVPMEPHYPLARKQAIAESAELTAILVDGSAEDTNALYIQVNDKVLEGISPQNINIETDPQALAYIIYTSGSTGAPKGVRIAHHAAVNLVSWVNREFNVNESDVMLFITSVSFDLSVYDIFGLLSVGGSLVIADQQQLGEPASLFRIMEQEQVTFWDSVPTSLNHLISDFESDSQALASLRLVFMSGDWIPVHLPGKIKQHFPNAQVISLGGATEGTVWSNYYPILDDSTKRNSIPYGKPIDNNRFYILDRQQRPVVKGVVGELYIGGVGVADGYQNDEEKTGKAFFDDSFFSHDINGLKARMYKTGDLGRLMPCGNMEILGRVDHQVKLRGFRIELGEIESVLCQHDLVKEAVVSLHIKEDAPEAAGQYLVAYVVAHNDSDFSKEVLTKDISAYLPEYMVPKVVIMLDKLPLNSNGKVDRKALPKPDISQQQALYVAPRTETETLLCEIWQEVLDVERVGITDNFFELGGHSLLATKLILKLNVTFDISLPLEKLFKAQSVETLAKLINEAELALSVHADNNEELLEDEVEFII